MKSKEVEIFRRGDEIVVREKARTTEQAFDLLTGLPDDFEVPDRSNDPPQKTQGTLLERSYLLDTTICLYIASAGRKKSCAGFRSGSPSSPLPSEHRFSSRIGLQ